MSDHTVPIHPGIYVHMSTEDSCSAATETALLTIQTRVPLEVLEVTDFVGDLFKDMFDGA